MEIIENESPDHWMCPDCGVLPIHHFRVTKGQSLVEGRSRLCKACTTLRRRGRLLDDKGAGLDPRFRPHLKRMRDLGLDVMDPIYAPPDSATCGCGATPVLLSPLLANPSRDHYVGWVCKGCVMTAMKNGYDLPRVRVAWAKSLAHLAEKRPKFGLGHGDKVEKACNDPRHHDRHARLSNLVRLWSDPTATW